MNEKDIFYYAKLHKIPIYFQPETNEVIGRNVFCDFLLWLIEPFEPLFVSEKGFRFEIEHRTITSEDYLILAQSYSCSENSVRGGYIIYKKNILERRTCR